MKKIKVAVMGASGYAGLELVRLLSRHPGVDLTAVTSREWAGKPFSEVFPALARICDLPFILPDPEAIAAAAAWSSPACRIRPPWRWCPSFWPGTARWWT